MTELKAEIVKLEKLLELSKQRVNYLEDYISHNNTRLLSIEDKYLKIKERKDDSSSNYTTKNSNDNDLYEKIDSLTTQVQIEKDIQKQMKKENIQLSINFNEITERYNFLDEQHYGLITEFDILLDKEKEYFKLIEEKVPNLVIFRKRK